MSEIVKRGWFDSDEKDFCDKAVERLREAQKDFHYLMNRNYPMDSIASFVGNHFAFSERQRMALIRSTSTDESIRSRAEKCVEKIAENQTVFIDGFNIIITLEVALSDSTLLHCMDDTVRDLAGLRGTYRLIDKTDTALEMVGKRLEEMKVAKAVFYLDRPVSNSGRLKARILEVLGKFSFETEVETVNDADQSLVGLENVVSSDAMVIERSRSWINFVKEMLGSGDRAFSYIALRG